jgi:hypothetical protein
MAKLSAKALAKYEASRNPGDEPSGAARSLLTIAKRRPEVLRELFADESRA